jgi:copper(I)-binding protein
MPEMMRALLAGSLLAGALLTVAVLPAAASEGGVVARQAWSRPAAAGGTGVGYVTLVNHGKADALIGAESSAAQKVELHETSMAGGVMKMAPETRIPLPAGGEVRFAPGGRHLMLIGLKRPLHPGDRVPATLHFASGTTLHVDFAVGTGAAPTDQMPGMPGMDHAH